MMRGPPLAPIASTSCPSRSAIRGLMLLTGFFPGLQHGRQQVMQVMLAKAVQVPCSLLDSGSGHNTSVQVPHLAPTAQSRPAAHRMKLAREGAMPYTFGAPGVEKSSIWLLSRMPGQGSGGTSGAHGKIKSASMPPAPRRMMRCRAGGSC